MKILLLPLTAGLILSACVKKVDTRISSSGLQNPSPASFILIAPEKTSSASYDIAQAEVKKRLALKGYSASDTGALYLQIGIASRPASLSLKQGESEIAKASGKKTSKRCPLKEYRLTVALTQISDGAEIYRSSAGEYHCKQSLEQVLPILADAALADIGAPRGVYSTKREID